jgi:sigma-B regulation protein RsbU (phosphoserine phosphatase)
MLCEGASRERYSTLFWSYFEPASETLRYINAGQCAPILFKPNGESLRLEDGGPVLGLLAEARFRQSSVRFEAGDTLVLYSDGIVEATNPQDDQFGEDRLEELVQALIAPSRKGGDSLSHSPAQIRATILSEVNRFTNHAELSDDRTLVVVRYEPTQVLHPVERSRDGLLPALV